MNNSACRVLGLDRDIKYVTRFFLFMLIIALTSGALMAQNAESPCSKLTLKGPTGIANPGDSVKFYLEAKDPNDLERVSFEWKVAGHDLQGQGTPRIQVPTTREDSLSTIMVTVRIVGRAIGCSAFLSESASVNWAGPAPDHFWQDISVFKRDDLKGQLDVFFLRS